MSRNIHETMFGTKNARVAIIDIHQEMLDGMVEKSKHLLCHDKHEYPEPDKIKHSVRSYCGGNTFVV